MIGLEDIEGARDRIAGSILLTPLTPSPSLSELMAFPFTSSSNIIRQRVASSCEAPSTRFFN